jgi:DNA polymerase III subunit beta
MELRIAKSELVRGFGFAGQAVTTNSPLPVMTMLLLRALDKVEMAGANATYTAIGSIEGSVVARGECCVPADRFQKYVNTLEEGEIHLRHTDGQLHLRAGRSKAKFPTLDAQEFPVLPQRLPGVAVDGAALSSLISKVVVARGSDRGRPTLTGINLDHNGHDLFVVATDGMRLGCGMLAFSAEPFSYLLPHATVDALVKMAGDIEIGMDGNTRRIIFSASDATIATSLLDGDYPVRRHHIPKGQVITALVDRAALKSALAGALVFAEDHYLTFTFSEDVLRVSASGLDMGSSAAELACETTGGGLEIGVNGRFVLDALSVCTSKRIAVRLDGNSAPMVFSEVGDSEYQYVLFPMHLRKVA